MALHGMLTMPPATLLLALGMLFMGGRLLHHSCCAPVSCLWCAEPSLPLQGKALFQPSISPLPTAYVLAGKGGDLASWCVPGDEHQVSTGSLAGSHLVGVQAWALPWASSPAIPNASRCNLSSWGWEVWHQLSLLAGTDSSGL